MHGLLRCNINAGVHARRRNGRVTQRCHNSPGGKRGYRVRGTSRTGSARRIWGILKKSVSWVGSFLGRRRLTFACSRRPCDRCARVVWWEDEKARIEKMCITLPHVEEPLNSKVIKSFVPKLRSRKCFSYFEIPMFYMYMLRTFYVRFAYPYSDIWLWYTISWCTRTSLFFCFVLFCFCFLITRYFAIGNMWLAMKNLKDQNEK